MEYAVGIEDPGGGDDMHVGMPEEKIPEGLHGDDEARLAGGAVGAEAEPVGDGEMGGVVEVVEQRAVPEEERADEPEHGENNVSMGHGRADGVGDEATLDESAPLVAAGAEAALFAGEGEEELVIALGAVQAGETGVQVAAAEEGMNRGSDLGRQGAKRAPVIVEDLPDGRSAGLAGPVASADHLGIRGGARGSPFPRSGQGCAIPETWYSVARSPRFHGTCSPEHSRRPATAVSFAFKAVQPAFRWPAVTAGCGAPALPLKAEALVPQVREGSLARSLGPQAASRDAHA